jgi:hypothetical protein
VVKDVKDYFAKEMEIVDEAEDEIEEADYFEEQANYLGLNLIMKGMTMLCDAL